MTEDDVPQDLVSGPLESEAAFGRLERFDLLGLQGWVLPRARADGPLDVVLDNGYGTLRLPVRIERPDVLPASMRGVAAGFQVAFADLRFIPQIEGLRVETTFSIEHGGKRLLSRRFWLNPHAARAGRYEWSLSIGERTRFAGWIRDRFATGPVGLALQNPLTGQEIIASSDTSPDGGAEAPEGFHPFDVQAPLKLSLRTSHLTLAAVEGGDRVLLGVIQLPALAGAIDISSTAELVEGWAVNMQDPLLRPLITVRKGRRQVGRGRASTFREDIKESLGGDGFCGYRVAMSSVKEGDEVFVTAELPTGETLQLQG